MNRNKTKLTIWQMRRLDVRSRSSMALLVTLMTLALMTIIVVAFLSTMNWEMQASRRNFESQKARGIAFLGLHTAIAQLRTALGQWDAPSS
jgi:type II secretory pathway component PulK